MKGFFYHHVEHCLFVAVLFSRCMDVLSTWLVTPRLRLEANPLVRKLKWPFALLTLLLAFVAYYHVGMAVAVLVISLMVSGTNFSRMWMVRAWGEEEYLQFILRSARRGSLALALVSLWLFGGFFALVGLLTVFLSPPGQNWTFWIGLGIIGYAVAILFHGSLSTLRFFKMARTQAPIQTTGSELAEVPETPRNLEDGL